jgi:hypothetical protein
MDHGDGVQDAHDAISRARKTYREGWHPILSAVETEPGIWLMVGQYGQPYAIIRSIEIGREKGYRIVTAAERREDRKLIGYFTSLRAATNAAHQRWTSGHARAGGINGAQ